jgi:hypothetical protein
LKTLLKRTLYDQVIVGKPWLIRLKKNTDEDDRCKVMPIVYIVLCLKTNKAK